MTKRRRSDYIASDSDSDDDVVVRYVPPNTIYYRGEIKEPEASQFCIKLHKAARKLTTTSTLPLTVFLSSRGGDVYAGISMYEHICMVKDSGVPVYVVVDGSVASAATLPLLAATKRVMCRNATFLVHAITSYTWGGYKPDQLKTKSENLDTLMAILLELYGKHCTMKHKELKRLLDTDRLLTYDECVRYGFVDGDRSLLS